MISAAVETGDMAAEDGQELLCPYVGGRRGNFGGGGGGGGSGSGVGGVDERSVGCCRVMCTALNLFYLR